MSSIRAVVVLVSLAISAESFAQLVWNQEMKQCSAILPLTLTENVYRVRAKPPKDATVQDITCDVGITGTVLGDQRGTSAAESAEKVVSSLMEHDDIDVYISDRVFSGNRDYAGNRIIDRHDFYCGINVKYQTKEKVAQLEIRVGYILPSGDIEGLTWAKLHRKQRIFRRNIAKCDTCRRQIADLEQEIHSYDQAGGNHVQQRLNGIKVANLRRSIAKKQNYASREDEFKRDLAAFLSLEEYLKTKVHGCHVHVHFQHDGKTLPVDIAELKRARIRPIQVFDVANDPIINR